MKTTRINRLTGSIFLLLGLINAAQTDYLAAASAALLGLGFWLSDLAYVSDANGPPVPPSALPAWRRHATKVLVVLALATFGYQIGRDIKAKQQRQAAPPLAQGQGR